MPPGTMVFNRTPCPTYSSAATLVIARTADLVDAYLIKPGSQMTLTSELMFRIAPFPDFAISGATIFRPRKSAVRSEEHTSELQSLMRISYAVFCLKKKKKTQTTVTHQQCTTVKLTNIVTKQKVQIKITDTVQQPQ